MKMTMQSRVFLKEIQGPVHLSMNVRRGSDHTMRSGADYEEAFAHPKPITSPEISLNGNQLNANRHDRHRHDREDGVKGNATDDHFSLLSSGDHRLTGQRTLLQISNNIVSQSGQLEFGFGQPLQYPFADPCNGVYSTYGTPIAGRILLTGNTASSNVDVPIYVNAKQYNGIMRRRKKRAEQQEAAENKLKFRKPYMHLSRHLHAMRRPRGSGGRFLNSKIPNTENPKKSKAQEEEDKHKQKKVQFYNSTCSQVLQSDNGGNDINRCGGGVRRSTCSQRSELSGHGSTFSFDMNQCHLHRSAFESSFSNNTHMKC